MIGRIGDLELGRRQREHPRDVDGDVAGAHHDHLLGLQVDFEPTVIWVAVVPGHELRGRVRATQVLAGDPEPFVDRRAQRVHDDVVVLQ